ncbi:MAG: hypothetical protein JWM27_4861 [Gemmatimonadetes bacterium]|nr:hypothetical protein [Gemmatimonadota bacterium]
MMIDFGGPEEVPARPVLHRGLSAAAPLAAVDQPGGAPGSDGLPALRLLAGYEVYRDATRTVLRVPGEARWAATIRTGPTSHRFVAAGADPAALWRAAGEAAPAADARPYAALKDGGKEP